MTDRRFPRLRRTLRTLLLGIVVAGGAPPRSAAGQEVTEEVGLPALIEFHLGVTQLAEVWAGEAGTAALLDIGAIRVGGGVWGVLRRIDEGPIFGGAGLELSLGYGGALIEYPIKGSIFAVRLLAGGGAATLRTKAVGARFDTETFAVLEPSATAFISFWPAISLGALFGYRWVQGADALFLAGSDDLRGPHATVFLRLGGH